MTHASNLPANNVMIMMKTAKSPSLILLAAASIALTLGVAACNKNPAPDNSAQSQPAQTDQSQDPAAAANLAPASETTQASGTNDQQRPANQARRQNYQQS